MFFEGYSENKYYADENGVLVVNKTVEIDGVKYRFGKDGAMVEK